MNLKDVKIFEELNLKQTFRAHIIYEKIMGHSFDSSDGLNGVIVLFYSYVLGSNKDWEIDYNDFMDWLDENPKMLAGFTNWLVTINKAENSFPSNEDTKDVSGEEAGDKKPKKA